MKDIIQILNHYKQGNVTRVAIYAISDKGRLKVQELNLNHGGKVRYKRLKELNERNEGIYFAPEDEYCNMLFLDDFTISNGLPQGSVVVQTSEGKYQAHIPYKGKPVSKSQRTEFQRQLCQAFKADIGAVYANHLRRLPGFRNQKYDSKPLVKILHVIEDGDPLTLEKLSQMTQKAQEEHKEGGGCVNRSKKYNPPPGGEIRKSWWDFYDDGNKSRADIRYTLYLLRKGKSESEIRNKLVEESLNIEERKIGHLDDYLNRTIRKAIEYIS